jgi:hypothetical protein
MISSMHIQPMTSNTNIESTVNTNIESTVNTNIESTVLKKRNSQNPCNTNSPNKRHKLNYHDTDESMVQGIQNLDPAGPVPAGPVPPGPVPAGPVPAGPVPAGPERECIAPIKRQKLSYFDKKANDPFNDPYNDGYYNGPDDKIVFLVTDKNHNDDYDDYEHYIREMEKLLRIEREINKYIDDNQLNGSQNPKKNTNSTGPPVPGVPAVVPAVPKIPAGPTPASIPGFPQHLNKNIIIELVIISPTSTNNSLNPPTDPPTNPYTVTSKSKKPKKTKKNTCNNPLCNHKTFEQDPVPPPDIVIQVIETIDDLIALGKAFHCKKQTTHRGLNLRLMNNLVQPLTELNEMIGLQGVKKHMVNQILFFLQGFNTVSKCNKCKDCLYNLPCIQNNTEMLHTVITGPPGVGKTCLARIIGKVYKAMGILSKGAFHEVTRSDFVGKYLGHTADKTQKLIDSCKGSVMFIDEAYSLGHKEKRDSFAKEALDTLNKNLSDRRDFLCIIAGYENELEDCFFSMNEGLRRRFTFRYKATEYDHKELADIFKLKVKLENWTIDLNSEEPAGSTKYSENDLISFFRQNKNKFPYSGGDIETLFLQCKISHGKRIPLERKCLSYRDIMEGFEQFTKNRKKNTKKTDDKEEMRPNMYILK